MGKRGECATTWVCGCGCVSVQVTVWPDCVGECGTVWVRQP